MPRQIYLFIKQLLCISISLTEIVCFRKSKHIFFLFSPGHISVLCLEVSFVVKDAFTSPGTQTTCVHLDFYGFLNSAINKLH